MLIATGRKTLEKTVVCSQKLLDLHLSGSSFPLAKERESGVFSKTMLYSKSGNRRSRKRLAETRFLHYTLKPEGLVKALWCLGSPLSRVGSEQGSMWAPQPRRSQGHHIGYFKRKAYKKKRFKQSHRRLGPHFSAPWIIRWACTLKQWPVNRIVKVAASEVSARTSKIIS